MIHYLFAILISHLPQDTSINGSIRIEGFDCKAWRTDSLGCEKKRYKIWQLIYDNREKIIGQKRSSIEQLLGPPNITSDTERTTFYFLNTGLQCSKGSKVPYRDIEVFKLGVTYKDAIAVDVFTMIP